MLRRIILFSIFFFSMIPQAFAQQQIPQITADAAVLMEFSNGQVLYSKNAVTKKAPASTTKVMTALLALDYAGYQQQVTISPKAASVGEASIHLQAGELFTMEDLLKGALIKSGNDAAYALAESIAGDADIFSNMMDRKAMALGAVNSHFINPNGLPSKEHLTTAYDLALITREALKNPIFNEIVKMQQATIPSGKWARHLENTNRLLANYPGADGVKTGTTRQAGSCLIASASRGGRRLIAVVLKSSDRYGDAQKLLEFGFQNFSHQKIGAHKIVANIIFKDEVELPLKTKRQITWSVPRGQEQLLSYKVITNKGLKLPVKKGEVAGLYLVYLDQELISCTELVSGEDLKQPSFFSRYFAF